MTSNAGSNDKVLQNLTCALCGIILNIRYKIYSIWYQKKRLHLVLNCKDSFHRKNIRFFVFLWNIFASYCIIVTNIKNLNVFFLKNRPTFEFAFSYYLIPIFRTQWTRRSLDCYKNILLTQIYSKISNMPEVNIYLSYIITWNSWL